MIECSHELETALSPPDAARTPEQAVASLSAEERLLVVLCDQLYEGRWEDLREDLEDRLAGKPYIFKLVHRIEDDLRRIARLQAIESALAIHLADYLPADAAP